MKSWQDFLFLEEKTKRSEVVFLHFFFVIIDAQRIAISYRYPQIKRIVLFDLPLQEKKRSEGEEKNVIKRILWKVYIPLWLKTLALKPIYRGITKFPPRSYVASPLKFASYHRKIIRVPWARRRVFNCLFFLSRSNFSTGRKNYSRIAELELNFTSISDEINLQLVSSLSLSFSSSSFNFCSRLIEKERFLRYVSFNVL